MKTGNVLVTGGAGFIGFHCVDTLTACGYQGTASEYSWKKTAEIIVTFMKSSLPQMQNHRLNFDRLKKSVHIINKLAGEDAAMNFFQAMSRFYSNMRVN